MPLISPIGRRAPRTIALIAIIYTLLIAGAVTMVYPFILMISGSTKSTVDEKEFVAIPGFLKGEEKLYQKHVEGLFNERLDLIRSVYDMELGGFDKLELAASRNSDVLIDEWERFVAEQAPPDYWYSLGYIFTPSSRTFPSSLRRYKKELRLRFDKNIGSLNQELETEFLNWNVVEVRPEFYLQRRSSLLTNPWYTSYRQFKQQQDPSLRYYFNVEGYYKRNFLMALYTRDIAVYNEAHGTNFVSYDDITLSPRLPADSEKAQADWENFVREVLSLLWVRLEPDAEAGYRAYLVAKYQKIAVLNKIYSSEFKSFDRIPLLGNELQEGIVQSDWDAFIEGWQDPVTGQMHRAAATTLRIVSPDVLFREHLQTRYGTIEQMNARSGTALTAFAHIQPPQRAMHIRAFQQNKKTIRNEFIRRNYITVIEYMILHGRGILNTVIYCALAVLVALIVNPMAAYALSRFKLPNTYKLLLFMLLTMAFPPMVTQIPVFLMLRKFELLNTFAALILPGMAHGYSIFLLKGFFDSLPGELYESAQMDGAGEWTMFWTITMSLSKPILAVIALTAFTNAYSNFMFALLICQNEKMWTLMVWLFQLQQKSGEGVMYASLIIAAIPTFVIFVFCQNIIMRGIVVPVEK
jgi:multiple sugar transport system permease protein